MYRRWRAGGRAFPAIEGFNSTARYERVTNTLDGSLTMERIAVFLTRWVSGGINGVIFGNSSLVGGTGWYVRMLNGTLQFGMGVSAAFVNAPSFSLAGQAGKIVIAFAVADGATVRLFRYDSGTDTVVEVGAGTSMGGAPVYTPPGGANLTVGNRATGGTSFPASVGAVLGVGGVEAANLTPAERLTIAQAIVSTGRIPSGAPLDLVWNAGDIDPDLAPWPSEPTGSELVQAGSDLALVQRTLAPAVFV